MQNIGFLLSWVGNPCRYLVLRPCKIRRILWMPSLRCDARPGVPVLATRTVNPENSEFSSVGTCKKYRRTVCSGTASRRKIMKNMTYRVLDPGFTMHACDAARDSTCMHGRMSWPAVSKELLAAKYGRVAPRCQTVWPFCWPQTALRQQRSSCLLCKGEPTP